MALGEGLTQQVGSLNQRQTIRDRTRTNPAPNAAQRNTSNLSRRRRDLFPRKTPN